MAFLGIDHPLIAVRDLEQTIATYRALGFFIAPPGQHPWGTSTALALFHHQILEIVSIGDPSLLDGYEAGGFRFGRHVERFLNLSEGVALTALFTEDAAQAEAELAARNIPCTGTVNFGRDVRRADGQPDRTKTTLKIFHNADMPRLSVFACQQHRRDLLEFPDRMTHPNGAHGFEAVTIAAEDVAPVLDWLCALHGENPGKDALGFDRVATTNGYWRIGTPAQVNALLGVELPDDFLASGPRIAGLDVRVKDLAQVQQAAAGVMLHQRDGALVVSDMAKLGGIALRFVNRS
ncbi:VOC family protein [Tropicibacter sp. R15_0]|uniref:VOC family protein n=1 Tax=Tropicibacter sp. R15_0 TaxID=2821101 RepID=UPI001ADABB33|nr:VOC family protein [Tropicibacter sp. R15_0]MBO9465439.1 VOC family protein [Tropicibacter sp. R15_0]